MIYLLGQILLCLLLAALAGWYAGWSWRGFRQEDRVEDLRRTLQATEEVKDRELAEAEREADALASRVETLERRAEQLEEELGGEGLRSVEDSPDADRASPGPEAGGLAELRRRVEDLDAELRREGERRQEAEAALKEKSSSLAELEAELDSLRKVTRGRAESVARLERQVLELEPLQERLARKEQEAEQLAARLRERSQSADETAELEGRLEECRKRLDDSRDRLRQARSALQRQIERNDKQEAVHQQVVANLQAEVKEAGREAPGKSDPGTERARWTQLVAERDSRITGLRRRLGELECRLERQEPADDLKKVAGIGPKLEDLLHSLGVTSFAQIAAWDDDDIERIGEHIGTFRGRIRRDDWVEGARRQHLLKYGEEPEPPASPWWYPDDEG